MTAKRPTHPTTPLPTRSPASAAPSATAGHSFTLLGAPRSGTNSKRIVRFGMRLALIKSKAATSWQASLVEQLRQQYHDAPMPHPVALSLTVYREKRIGDVDNTVKPVMDALERAGVLVNDKQVCELHVVRHLDRSNPRVEVTIHATKEAA